MIIIIVIPIVMMTIMVTIMVVDDLTQTLFRGHRVHHTVTPQFESYTIVVHDTRSHFNDARLQRQHLQTHDLTTIVNVKLLRVSASLT